MTPAILKGVSRPRQSAPIPVTRIMREWNDAVDFFSSEHPERRRELEDVIFIIIKSFPLLDGINPAEFACELCKRASDALVQARGKAKKEFNLLPLSSLRYRSLDLDTAEKSMNGDGRRGFDEFISAERPTSKEYLDFIRYNVGEELWEHLESPCGESMLWNYPKFCEEILRSAQMRSRRFSWCSTQELIRSALEKDREGCFSTLFGPNFRGLLVRDCLAIKKPRGRPRTAK